VQGGQALVLGAGDVPLGAIACCQVGLCAQEGARWPRGGAGGVGCGPEEFLGLGLRLVDGVDKMGLELLGFEVVLEAFGLKLEGQGVPFL
jgi:hypothetical protein